MDRFRSLPTTLRATHRADAGRCRHQLLYAFSWVFAFIGLSSSSPEASNAYGFTILFPLTFVSSAFVPVGSMPGWLQPIAEHNPFTTMVDAARALFLGIPAGNDVWLAVVWTLAIIAVFAPLSAWRYRRVTR
jgi:ABC-2 type transport system permease protein